MTRIPIDLTAPIACTADGGELSTRVGQLEHLRDRLQSLERTDQGILLRFPAHPGLEADLQQLVVDEKGCCQFWGFELGSSPTGLALRWDGPPDAQALLDELHRWFVGDEPLTALSGLR